MTFDPRAYWSRTVPDIDSMMPFTPITPEHVAQEAILLDLLHGLDFDSALEVGCGLGRITSILAGMAEDITAIDIGSDQVAVTRRRVPDAIVTQSSIQDFEADRKWDLVLASEVLMHIPPAEIQSVCDKLKSMARKWIVTIDWTAPLGDEPIAEENWLHDYPELFGSVEQAIPTNLQTVFLIRP